MVKADKSIIDVCCEHRISNATYYSWRCKFGDKALPSESPAKSNSDSNPDKVAGLCSIPEKKAAASTTP